LTAVEELDGLSNDLDLRALRAVLRFPGGPIQPAVHSNTAALRQMIVESVCLVAKHFDVEEVRLVDPVAAFVLLSTVDRDAQLEHCRPGGQMSKLRVPG